jgi:hypothetical protein
MSYHKWEVLYTDANEPKILINFNTMQIKMIEDFDNNSNKKRKRNIEEEDDQSQNIIVDNNNDQKKDDLNEDANISNEQSQNDDTEDDDEDDDIDNDESGSSSKMPQEKCKHYIKNHILDSHEKDVKRKARNYMHDKKVNKKRGALPKWVKQALN